MDADLHMLLTNARAVNVTTSLSVMGCTSIQGRGLAALMYSRCLEQIDLRKSRQDMTTLGPTGLDDAFVLGALLSMAPINTQLPHSHNGGLKHVKIRQQFDETNYYSCFNNQIQNFLSDLNDAIALQLRERRVPCENCKKPLVDAINKEYNFTWMARTCYCSRCKTYKCGNSCKERVLECRVCMEQLCPECQVVLWCTSCEKCYCNECKPVGRCSDYYCTAQCCQDCLPTTCCQSCRSTFCNVCQPVRSCDACERSLCNICDPVRPTKCQNCGYCSCYECNVVSHAWKSCQGTCSNCDLVCECGACKSLKQQLITKYFRSLGKSLPKCPQVRKGEYSKCGTECICAACKVKKSKQQLITKYFEPAVVVERASKRPRLS